MLSHVTFPCMLGYEPRPSQLLPGPSPPNSVLLLISKTGQDTFVDTTEGFPVKRLKLLCVYENTSF